MCLILVFFRHSNRVLVGRDWVLVPAPPGGAGGRVLLQSHAKDRWGTDNGNSDTWTCGYAAKLPKHIVAVRADCPDFVGC